MCAIYIDFRELSDNCLSWKQSSKAIVQLHCNEQAHLQLDHISSSPVHPDPEMHQE